MPAGFWRAHSTGALLERGAPSMSGHDVSAADVYAGEIVAHEIREGAKRATERAEKAAERMRELLSRPRGGGAA